MMRFKLGSFKGGKNSSHIHKTSQYARLLWLLSEQKDFALFLREYAKAKGYLFSGHFEKHKNNVVKGVLIKRGKSNRIFLHMSVLSILTVGVVVSPLLSDSNPFGNGKNTYSYAQEVATTPAALASDDVFHTNVNDKIRTEILTYKVQKGDTVSLIAKKFDVSEDTIRWENSLKGDSITVGDELKILPVTGVSHKVASGETVYSIAKKYGANAQAIVDFPKNDFANPQTFSLVAGTEIIVPDGVRPEEKPTYTRPSRYYAQAAPGVVGASGFSWPIQGTMNQYFAWYHPAVDLGASTGTPVAAAQSGTVITAQGGWNYGYGNHVVIQGDNGYTTLYAHLSGINVSVGQRVSAGGTTIGWVGSTGRSTGPHLHFEVRGSGGNINPLSVLK